MPPPQPPQGNAVLKFLELAALALIPLFLAADFSFSARRFRKPRFWRLRAFAVSAAMVVWSTWFALTLGALLEGIAVFDLAGLGLWGAPIGVLVYEFGHYWYHRAEHQFNWWWGLHSLHHSQRHMNLWSDNRNHLLDDLIRDIYMAAIALVIGVEPSQYVLLIMASRMLQSLQHANVRLHFGAIGERILVSPRYHRLHHAIGIGHESQGKGTLGGCNFAVLFPIWDILFRTARFDKDFVATGVRDQLPAPEGEGREYGHGFWKQQWLGIKHMIEFARRSPS